MKKLTPPEALALLERAVAEKGNDYIYPYSPQVQETGQVPEHGRCVYFEDDAPSCIVGHVFAYAGATSRDVEEGTSVFGQNIQDAGSGNATAWEGDGSGNATTWEVDGFTYDLRVASILYAAQKEQDAGSTWGAALEAAKQTAEALAESA